MVPVMMTASHSCPRVRGVVLLLLLSSQPSVDAEAGRTFLNASFRFVRFFSFPRKGFIFRQVERNFMPNCACMSDYYFNNLLLKFASFKLGMVSGVKMMNFSGAMVVQSEELSVLNHFFKIGIVHKMEWTMANNVFVDESSLGEKVLQFPVTSQYTEGITISAVSFIWIKHFTCFRSKNV